MAHHSKIDKNFQWRASFQLRQKTFHCVHFNPLEGEISFEESFGQTNFQLHMQFFFKFTQKTNFSFLFGFFLQSQPFFLVYVRIPPPPVSPPEPWGNTYQLPRSTSVAPNYTKLAAPLKSVFIFWWQNSSLKINKTSGWMEAISEWI